MPDQKIAATVTAIQAWQERTDTTPAVVLVPVGWIDAMRDELEDQFGNKPWRDEWATPVLVILGARVEESVEVVGPVCGVLRA